MANPPMVLVADDREDIQEMLSEAFCRAGYAVATAHNGIEVVGAAFRLLPELIVLDFDLPGRNGCDAARILKTDRRTRRTPIILFSGVVQTHFMELARQAGCDRVLRKPISIETLLCEAQQLLLSLERATPHDARKLLIVDDDDRVRSAMAQLLEDAGFETAEAADGEEALELLRVSTPPDVILLDLMMPEMNGWEFRREQLRDPALAGIPVVVMTALPEAQRAMQRLKPALCLGKPPSIDELFRFLERSNRYQIKAS